MSKALKKAEKKNYREYASPVPQRILSQCVFVLVFLATLVLLWAKFTYMPLDWPGLLMFSLKFSAPLLVGLIVLSIFVSRDVDIYERGLGPVMTTLFGLYFMPALAFGVMAAANRYLEQGPAVERTALITGAGSASLWGGARPSAPNYYAFVESWRSGVAVEKIPVTSFDAKHIQPRKSTMRVVTRPGALGYEWLESVDVRLS